MIRIHTGDATARWRFKCPSPACRSVDWRVRDGTIACGACRSIHRELWDDKEGRIVPRSELEFVGPGSEKVDFAHAGE